MKESLVSRVSLCASMSLFVRLSEMSVCLSVCLTACLSGCQYVCGCVCVSVKRFLSAVGPRCLRTYKSWFVSVQTLHRKPQTSKQGFTAFRLCTKKWKPSQSS